jgi:DNA replication protein DnaC
LAKAEGREYKDEEDPADKERRREERRVRKVPMPKNISFFLFDLQIFFV